MASHIPLSAALSHSNLSRDELIVHYADLGYSTKEIQAFLSINVHEITLRYLT